MTGPDIAAMTPSTTSSATRLRPVLLFDGECGLCNRIVRFMLRLDGAGRLHYAPLQGPSAQSYLRAQGLPTVDFDTIVFVPDWNHRERPEYLLRTAGIIAALRAIGGMGRVFAATIAIFPARLRDAVYRGIGHWRYRVFGPWKERPLPRAEWATRFLS